MAIQKEFESELDKLFEVRTHWIRRAVGLIKLGRPKKIDKEKIKVKINKLNELAEKILIRDLLPALFEKMVNEKRQWRVTRGKGRGVYEKQRAFDRWFTKQIPFSNCIYVFWAGQKCKYIGRTIKGKGRPQNYFDKYWFQSVTRIDIYSTSRASELPALECMAVHRFEPSENDIKPSKRKWAKKCLICRRIQLIKGELKKIFRLK